MVAAMLLVRGGQGFGQPPGGRGGFGPPGGPDLKLVERFDADANGRLDDAERSQARAAATTERATRGGGRGGFGRGRESGPPPQPGRRIEREEARAYPGIDLYDPSALRTIFLDFSQDDWEKELADFYGTDVEVPAMITVDGRSIEGVGVHFRGASSYFSVGEGFKRSLNIAIDHTDPKASLLGYRTLNLLNGHGDPSLMSTVLYAHIAGRRIPTPRANFVRLVINGEDWGVYTNVEQANKDFLKRAFGDGKGDRWKVKGRPGGRGGLEYFGDDPAAYTTTYELKTKDTPEAWRRLIDTCKRLADTPPERIEADLASVLDLDGILWFLALDNTLVNSDGYWTRASDYTLFADADGRFHLIPHDMNEAFSSGHGGPGGPGGPRRGGRGGFPFGSPLAAFDGNHNGRVERGELAEVVARFAGAINVDDAGTFGADELAAALEKALPPPPGFWPAPDRGGRPDGDRRSGGPSRMIAGALFAAVDTAKRSRISREEFATNAVSAALAADADADGSLDEEEVAGLMQRVMPPPGGPGGRGPGGGGPTLDPLVGLDDSTKPLRAKLLAVPALRDRYLDHVKAIAREQLDWAALGPEIARWRALIIDAVREDTRMLDTTEAFEQATSPEPAPEGRSNLRSFLEKRRTYLLDYTPPHQATDPPHAGP